MDIMVLGGNGMLGHKIFQFLSKRLKDTWCTVRGRITESWMQPITLFRNGKVIENVDALEFSLLEEALKEWRPKVIVNCIGVIKQRADATVAIPSIAINSLLPHRLAGLCQAWGGRLIHFSTDCVFSGNRGNYSEEDDSDAKDLYGRSKFLGEVATTNALTLRTSIIGRELSHFASLLEWFLGQDHKKVNGYGRVFYSGVTTNYLAELVAQLIENQPRLSGLYQVTSPTISKYDLLLQLRDAFRMDVEIIPDDRVFCDRSMQGGKFLRATGLKYPEWPDLVAQLANDDTPYENWRLNGHEGI